MARPKKAYENLKLKRDKFAEADQKNDKSVENLTTLVDRLNKIVARINDGEYCEEASEEDTSEFDERVKKAKAVARKHSGMFQLVGDE